MDKRISKAYDFIKRRFREKISLHRLAQTVGVSPFHFQRLYKEQLKESPRTSLLRIRLERARHLLVLDPTRKMASISRDCGFSSPSAFSRSFTQWFGRTPMSISREIQAAPRSRRRSLKVDLHYVPDTIVLYEHTSMTDPRLMQEFVKVKTVCERSDIQHTGKMLGILTHEALHGPRTGLNYYAGIEIKAVSARKSNADDLYRIPTGLYACFKAENDHDSLRTDLMNFKNHWLDSSNYLIADVFAFELFVPKNQGYDRVIHIPVKHKRG